MSNTESEQAIRDQVKALLRRELKLGEEAEIPDEMTLVGGDFELDSLDVVLLVSAVEKAFGVSVRSPNVGQDAFADVGSLVQFIAARQAEADPGGEHHPAVRDSAHNGSTPYGAVQNGTANEGAAPQVTAIDPGRAAVGNGAATDEAALLANLPHQPPFRFISSLDQRTAGEQAIGRWAITGEEAFFVGHFPGRPVVPGVLISEALAQLSGLVTAGPASEENGSAASPGSPAPAAASANGTPPSAELAHVDVRFKQPVTPPATIELTSRVIRTQDGLEQFEVQARRGDTVVADGRIALKRGPGG